MPIRSEGYRILRSLKKQGPNPDVVKRAWHYVDNTEVFVRPITEKNSGRHTPEHQKNTLRNRKKILKRLSPDSEQ